MMAPAFLRNAPLLIFLIAFIPRLAAALWLPDSVVWPDGHRYERIALSLLNGDGFGDISINRLAVPTQPVLIAAIYSVFGDSYLALRIFFAVLGSATCVFGFAVAKRLFDSPSVIFVGLILAFYPYYIYLSALFEVPQTFYIFIISAFFALYFRYLDSNQRIILFLSGLCLGLGILTVPTVLIFVPFVFLPLLSGSFAESAQRCIIVAIAIAIPVGSWATRNYIAYDKFILVNSAGGTAFWLANNEDYYRFGKSAVITKCAREQKRAGLCPICVPEYKGTKYCAQQTALHEDMLAIEDSVAKVTEQQARGWQHGLEWVRNSPASFVSLSVRKAFNFWSPIPDAINTGSTNPGTLRNLVLIISYTPILILAVWGAVLSRKRWRKLFPVYAYFLVMSTPYYVFLPNTRYRLPVDFILIVFAGFAVAVWWESYGRNWLTRAQN